MKIQKTHPHTKGYTLVELTAAILVGLLISATALTLMSNQLQAFRIIRTQDFLVHEAPQINNTLNRIVSRADFFRMYASFDHATAATNSVTAGGTTLVLQFQSSTHIDSTGDLLPPSFGVIHFNATTSSLDYFTAADLAALGALDSSKPSWNISTQATGVNYSILNGVLRLNILGPNSDSITFSSTTLK